MPGDLAPLGADVLWLATRKSSVQGRACREYHVATEDTSLIVWARAFPWRRNIDFCTAEARPCLTIVRRRAFALTGRADVVELPSTRPLGTVSRSGTFRDPSGRVCGRFRDARSFRQRCRESLVFGILDAVFQNSGGSVASGPDRLVLHRGRDQQGTLSYAILPFPHPANVGLAAAPPRSLPGWAPRVFREAWHSLNAPRGWKLVRLTPADEPWLELAAAIFAAELSRW